MLFSAFSYVFAIYIYRYIVLAKITTRSPYRHKYAVFAAWDVRPYLGTDLLCVLFIWHFLSGVMFLHFNRLDFVIVLS